MAVEIERKFLVRDRSWQPDARGETLVQGYLAKGERAAVRVRVKGAQAFLTVKAAVKGTTRSEFDYVVPMDDAETMLRNLCAQPLIEKTRYRLPLAPVTFEIDVFAGANAGLIIAEVELPSADAPFPQPSWLGPDVSDDMRFFNAYLDDKPFTSWGVSYDRLLRELDGAR